MKSEINIIITKALEKSEKTYKNQRIIFFDGYCNLCNNAVDFIISRNSSKNLYYASLQSDIAKTYLLDEFKDKNWPDSIILYDKGKVFIKSTAALKLARDLRGFWPLAGLFLIVPKFIRDWVYDFIAKHRYKWFGKKETCRVATEDEKSRFLS